MSKRTRRTLNAGLAALSAGTAWAGAHFPSEGLFDMRPGNFIGAVVNDAFLGIDPNALSQLTLVPQRGGAEMRWQVIF